MLSVSFSIMCSNARLYEVGRGFFARYESFRPNGCDWGERNIQFTMEPRLPYTALLALVSLSNASLY